MTSPPTPNTPAKCPDCINTPGKLYTSSHDGRTYIKDCPNPIHGQVADTTEHPATMELKERVTGFTPRSEWHGANSLEVYESEPMPGDDELAHEAADTTEPQLDADEQQAIDAYESDEMQGVPNQAERIAELQEAARNTPPLAAPDALDPGLKALQFKAVFGSPEARTFVHKWAEYFARNGTGYFEHMAKDDEAVKELDALIARLTQEARIDGARKAIDHVLVLIEQRVQQPELLERLIEYRAARLAELNVKGD